MTRSRQGLAEPATLTSVCAQRAATALQGSRDVWRGDWGAERELAERIGGAVLQAQFSTRITTDEGS